jgi:hypothetical protein
MFHTAIWDVQYSKIRVKYAYAYNTIIFFSNFGSAHFDLDKPDSPQNQPKRFQLFSNILYVVNISSKSIGACWKAVFWAEIAWTGQNLP